MKKRLLFSITLILILLTPTVFSDDVLSDQSISSSEFNQTIEVSNNNSEIPTINARHAVVIDRNSNTILYGKKETEQCKMASTTKIMTAIVVIENSNLNDIITVSSKAAGTGGSRLGLHTSDKITVENLLYGLMMRSGNDAAVALAEYVGGDVNGFAELMNNKASELNLTSTHFVTPHGLDNDDHYTTAYDLALLTNYALENETFAKIVKTKTYTITLNGYSQTLSNTNELLGNLEGVYGVKTGFTNGANRCLVTSCKRGDLDIICVVLGCDTKKDRTQDSIKLINYVFNNFSVVNIEEIINSDFNQWYSEHSNSFTINKGTSQTLDLYLNSLPYSTLAVNNSEINKICTLINFTSYHQAPIYSDTRVGEIILFVNDKKYLSIDILNSNFVDKKNVFDYFYNLLSNYCNYMCNY